MPTLAQINLTGAQAESLRAQLQDHNDGDEVTLKAWCEAEGAVRIGFGECVGRVEAAA